MQLIGWSGRVVAVAENSSGEFLGDVHPCPRSFLARFFHLIQRSQRQKRSVAITKEISIRASVDALCRDGTSEISRDPRTKRLQTRRESLARPSKHTNNNFWTHI